MISKDNRAILARLLSYEQKNTLILLFSLSFIGFIIAALGRLGLAGFPRVLELGWENLYSIWIALVPLYIISSIALQGVGYVLGSFFLSWMARRIIQKTRSHLIKSLLNKKQDFFDNESSDSLSSLLIYHVEQVYSGISNGIINLIRETLTVIFLLGYLLYLNALLTLILLLVVPLAVVIVRYIAKRFYILSKRIQFSMEDINKHSSEMLRAIQLIRLYASSDFQNSRFDNVNQANYRQNIKLVITQLLSSFVLEMVVALLVAAMVALVLSNAFGNQFTSLGSFISYITTVAFIGQPVKKLSQVLGVIQRGIAAAERVFVYIDLPGEEQATGVIPDKQVGNIVFDRVSMHYANGTTALKDVSFKIDKGKVTALVGKSGSGKTTIANLLLRFYDISNGAINIDGKDLRSVSLDWLRSNFALVSQHQMFFNDTITSNIAYAEENVDFEKVKQVADMALVTEFVERYDLGFDTIIGDNGSLLSGGQKQRLSIARALYRDAPVLIFDEATSALDNESDIFIQKTLKALKQNKTLLIITHKLTNIMDADSIAVFDNGELVELGNHQQLLNSSGLYSKFYKEKDESSS